MNKREKIIGVALLIITSLWAVTKWPHKAAVPSDVSQILPRTNAAQTRTPAAGEKPSTEYKRVLDKVFLDFGPEQTFNEITDPFKKFDSKDLMDKKVLELSELQLKGVVFEKNVPVALINDQILRVGDSVSGFSVVEIRSNEVVLTRGLEKYTLRLFEQQEK